MPAERQHTDEHALIGFGGMARQGKRVATVIAAVHVRYLQFGSEDGCLEGHVFQVTPGNDGNRVVQARTEV